MEPIATLPEHGTINVVDIGAMILGDDPAPYLPLVEAGKARVVGFEPNEKECAKLNARGGAERYYPYFIGDGSERTYYETNFTMTGSLYPPNEPLLKKFTALNELMELRRAHPGIKTRRLDDLAALEGLGDVDMIKIDVQGAELDVFRGARKTLQSVLVIITEVEFVPLYVGQPLFADVDQHLRDQGFMLHTFKGFGQRFFRPFVARNDVSAGFRQLLWSDAVYVSDVMHFDQLSDDKLVKLAAILSMTLGSHDLAAVALAEYDRRHQTSHAAAYVTAALEQHAAARKASA